MSEFQALYQQLLVQLANPSRNGEDADMMDTIRRRMYNRLLRMNDQSLFLQVRIRLTAFAGRGE